MLRNALKQWNKTEFETMVKVWRFHWLNLCCFTAIVKWGQTSSHLLKTSSFKLLDSNRQPVYYYNEHGQVEIVVITRKEFFKGPIQCPLYHQLIWFLGVLNEMSVTYFGQKYHKDHLKQHPPILSKTALHRLSYFQWLFLNPSPCSPPPPSTRCSPPSPLHEMLTPSPLHEMRSLGCCSPSYLASPMNACVPICAADNWASMLLKSFHAAS